MQMSQREELQLDLDDEALDEALDDVSSNSTDAQDDNLDVEDDDEGDILLQRLSIEEAASRDIPWPSDSESLEVPRLQGDAEFITTQDIDSLEILDGIQSVGCSVGEASVVLYGEAKRYDVIHIHNDLCLRGRMDESGVSTCVICHRPSAAVS